MLRTLKAIAAATEYAPAQKLLRRLLSAWLARWGDAVPGQPPVQQRIRVL